MTSRIALIRGINVGGTSTVPMAELRSALTERGLENVRTYIQSGNIVYDPAAGAKSTAAALRAEGALVAAAISDMKGFVPAVMVFTVDELAGHLAASPFADADPAKAFVVFVDGDPSALGDFGRHATNGEQCQVIDGMVHLHAPNGIGRSKLWATLAGSTNVPTTTRNLRTIAKVLELAG